MSKKAILIIMLFCCPRIILAKNHASKDVLPGQPIPNKLNTCLPTKPAINNYEPKIFNPTNNLLRSAGQQAKYCGHKVIIHGKIVNQQFLPMSDAKVYLWQVGCDGKYPYKPLKTRVDPKKINLKAQSTFTGSGIATTDNQGEFHFITIYPAKEIENRPPFVNVRVEHDLINHFQTQLVLTEKYVATSETKISNAHISEILENEDVTIYHFQIVIPALIEKRY